MPLDFDHNFDKALCPALNGIRTLDKKLNRFSKFFCFRSGGKSNMINVLLLGMLVLFLTVRY